MCNIRINLPYIKVTLKDLEGHPRTFWVHRIIGILFLPPPKPGQTQINHKNGNKLDNFVFINDDGSVDLDKSNLEWCTGKQNCANPNTREIRARRYHREGEFKRRSDGQKERYRKHPEDLQKLWAGRRKWLASRL